MANSPSTITVKIEPDMLAAVDTVKELIRDAVARYSEWLDSEGLMADPGDDIRTHDGLVEDFFGSVDEV